MGERGIKGFAEQGAPLVDRASEEAGHIARTAADPVVWAAETRAMERMLATPADAEIIDSAPFSKTSLQNSLWQGIRFTVTVHRSAPHSMGT